VDRAQGCTAARTAHAGNQLRAPQLAEQLLQIGKRDVLALADGRERNRAAILAERQIDHGGHCEPAFCRESHDELSNTRLEQSSISYSDQFTQLKFYF